MIGPSLTTDALCYVASLILLAAVSILRPSHARCPKGWWLSHGVRPTGEYVCQEIVPERAGVSARGGYVDLSAPTSHALYGKIYCTGISRAISVDGVAVGCQPGGWTSP